MNKIIHFVISSSISLTALSNSWSTIPFTIGSLRNKRNPTAIQSVANKIEIYILNLIHRIQPILKSQSENKQTRLVKLVRIVQNICESSDSYHIFGISSWIL